MNSNSTNVYKHVKEEFKNEFDRFDMEDIEMGAFLHYNAYNKMLNSVTSNGIIYEDLDTGRKYKLYENGSLIFCPKDVTPIEPNNNFIAFYFGKTTKCVKINENGLFIEEYNLKGEINVSFYDRAALYAISTSGLKSCDFIGLERHIWELGIEPDRIISVKYPIAGYIEDVANFSVVENGEKLEDEDIEVELGRTLYSVFYEFMVAHNCYDKCQNKNDFSRKFRLD